MIISIQAKVSAAGYINSQNTLEPQLFSPPSRKSQYQRTALQKRLEIGQPNMPTRKAIKRNTNQMSKLGSPEVAAQSTFYSESRQISIVDNLDGF